MKKRKIAILGGGVAGTVAAYWLTRTAELRARYDVTLYQLGWRLGGKGASGRNQRPGYGLRSEEHGVHVWFGLYENAFRTIRECYDLLGTHGPFKSWRDAFRPADEAVLADNHQARWKIWRFSWLREKRGIPGDDTPLPTLWDYYWRALDWLLHNINQRPHLVEVLPPPAPDEWPIHGPIRRIAGVFRRSIRHVTLAMRQAPTRLHLAVQIFDSLPADPRRFTPEEVTRLLDTLAQFRRDLFALVKPQVLEAQTDWRRLRVTVDLAITCLRGALQDDIFSRGLDSLDDEEFQAWLGRHGAKYPTTKDSALVRSLYGAPFAFEDGDPDRPNMAAGAALRASQSDFFRLQRSVSLQDAGGNG